MRCFVAIQLDQQITEVLAAAKQLFRDVQGKIAYVKREQIHLTLKFLADVPESKLPDVKSAVQTVATAAQPFEFSIAKLGCFPPRGQVRVIWVGIDAPPQLLTLQQACEEQFAQIGFQLESRPFKPHLTIGRAKFLSDSTTCRQIIDANQTFHAGTQTVEKITLFSSQLKPTGAVHTPLTHAALALQH